ncbi:MAG: GntR family transcriptional regulator [Phycisphaerales bacterium]|nr:GntR family transcriptional regulator [Phycisphaerales bacterium]
MDVDGLDLDGPGAIVRVPLRAQIREIVLDRIIRGAIAGGTRINETHLAAELRVSRTPLREALLGLQREGFLLAEMGKGFRVPEMSVGELLEVSPINAALEALAIRTTGARIRGAHAELLRITEAISAHLDDGPRVYELNVAWHRALTGLCGNDTLQRMLRAVRERCYRYQYCYMLHRHELEPLRRSKGFSPRRGPVTEAVERGDAELAAELAYRLEVESGETLAAWMRAR